MSAVILIDCRINKATNITAKIAAIKGAINAAIVRITLAIFSPDATNELPNPIVRVDDSPRIATVVT